MSIIEKLAGSLGRRDEGPNLELAKEIAGRNDKAAIKELVQHLNDKKLQSDCIKVLYETGELDPALIAAYTGNFVSLLDSRNNRLQWGAMTALNAIAAVDPGQIFDALPRIVNAADKGSVITRDNCVKMLVKLCSVKQYANDAFILLMEQLQSSPANQLPMYAELAAPVVSADNKQIFVSVLASRLNEIEKDSKRKRVEKLIARLKNKSH